MTNKEYRAADAISRSELIRIAKSPLHFKYAKEHPQEDTPSLLFGRALHKYVLEPDTFEDEFAVCPLLDRRTKQGREDYAAFLELSAGKDVITQADYITILEMCDVARKNELVMQLLNGAHEESWFWTDPDTGEKCKCRTDCITTYGGEKVIVDYKTTESCAGYDFERSAKKYGYDVQAGMYTEGLFANTFEEHGFKFIVQEKKAPYAIRIYTCSPEYIQQGVDRFKELLGIYHDCRLTDNWYGYEGPDNADTVLYGEWED